MSNPVVIVDYTHRWPLIYEKERHHIVAVARHRVLSVEHIGSTAVVGLGAKPIIDIMLGVNGLPDAGELLSLLGKIGYEEAIRQQGDSEWYYCLKKIAHEEDVWCRNFHLHLMKFRSETWRRHILFRDFLRNHSEVAQKYDKLKRMLAEKYGIDREGYTNAKTEFIVSVVKQAIEK